MIGINIKCSNNLVNAMGGARDRRHSVPFVLKNRDYSMILRVQVCSQGGAIFPYDEKNASEPRHSLTQSFKSLFLWREK